MRWIASASAVVADLMIGTEPPSPVKMTQNCQFHQRHDRKVWHWPKAARVLQRSDSTHDDGRQRAGRQDAGQAA
jgi:hypothetical protein